MKTKTFDNKFEDVSNILDALDLLKSQRNMQNQNRVNVDVPGWMLESIDKEASRVGVTRQSSIIGGLVERFESGTN